MPTFCNFALSAALLTSTVLGQPEPCPPATTSLMTYNGQAKCMNGVISLAEAADQKGTTFTSSTFNHPSTYRFETFLEYSIGGKGDGVAFVLHNDPNGLSAAGTFGGAMGVYSGSPTSGPGGIASALVVEFDVFFNSGPSAPFSTNPWSRSLDIITTDVNGVATRHHEVDLSLTAAWSNQGKMWIEYSTREDGVLDVYFGGQDTGPKPSFPLVSVPIDLPSVLLGSKNIFCGVAASTGSNSDADAHDIITFTGCDEVGSKQCSALLPGPRRRSRAVKCPGYSTCNCQAGPGGFLECLSGGVTERCSSCSRECKDFEPKGKAVSSPVDVIAKKDGVRRNRKLLDEKKKSIDFRCGCFDLLTDEPIDCVPFNFPEDCVTGCDNSNVIQPALRDACLCHFVNELKCSPEKCLQDQLARADAKDDSPSEESDCRCFCQSYFADYGGPHSNCVDIGDAPAPETCPVEGIRAYGRLPAAAFY